MAIEYKFTCNEYPKDYLTVKSFIEMDKEHPNYKEGFINVTVFDDDNDSVLILDIPTAIKLHKTLRVEIAKIKEGGNNG
jgi:hypothetical protein